MAATLEAVPNTKTAEKKTEISEADAARELVKMAKEQGLFLTGPDGLLKQLTKTVIQTALGEEMTEHLGYEKHDSAGKQTANFPQWSAPENGADRDHRPRPGGRAAGPTGHGRTRHRQEAPAPPDGG